MRRECWERFPRHRLQRNPLVSDPSIHHGTYVTHVPWCMSGSLTRGGGENVPCIYGACANANWLFLIPLGYSGHFRQRWPQNRWAHIGQGLAEWFRARPHRCFYVRENESGCHHAYPVEEIRFWWLVLWEPGCQGKGLDTWQHWRGKGSIQPSLTQFYLLITEVRNKECVIDLEHTTAVPFTDMD